GRAGALEIPLLNEVPAAVEMRGELIHSHGVASAFFRPAREGSRAGGTVFGPSVARVKAAAGPESLAVARGEQDSMPRARPAVRLARPLDARVPRGNDARRLGVARLVQCAGNGTTESCVSQRELAPYGPAWYETPSQPRAPAARADPSSLA